MTLRAPTHTRISLDLSFAGLAPQHARLECDGVGLLRAESLALSLGIHPRKLLADGNEEKLLGLLSQGIVRVARDFAPRPVVYRMLDLKSNEYAGLAGGAEYEEKEENPALGLHGCSRYLADVASFRLELRAVKRARDMGCVNVDVILPFARSPDELARCREIVIEEGLFASAEFELWMMAEVPSSVLLIEDFLPYVSGVCIGSNDLTQLVLGIDRGNRRLANGFDQRHPAVLAAIKRVARACHERGVACSICGDAPGHYPEMIAELVEAGLTGLNAAPEAFAQIVAAVAAAEGKLGILPEREIAK